MDENSPFFVGGGFFVVKAMNQAVERIESHFRDGGGMLWGEHHPDLFVGTARFFRPGYAAYLTSLWIPSLNGVEERLRLGLVLRTWAAVMDFQLSSWPRVILTLSFGRSITTKRPSRVHVKNAAAAGVADSINSEVTIAQTFPDNQYDLIAFFDCLHDMGDPVGACKRAAEVLAPDGSAMIVEPMAGNTVEENFNPIGRTFSGASTLCCTSNSMAQNGPALGAVASEDAIRKTVLPEGLHSFAGQPKPRSIVSSKPGSV